MTQDLSQKKLYNKRKSLTFLEDMSLTSDRTTDPTSKERRKLGTRAVSSETNLLKFDESYSIIVGNVHYNYRIVPYFIEFPLIQEPYVLMYLLLFPSFLF